MATTLNKRTSGGGFYPLGVTDAGKLAYDPNPAPTPTNGRDGINGLDGKNGKDGVDGKDGVNGTNGTNGRDGIDATGGQISTADPIHFSTITQFAKKRTVRVLYTGTSLANNANSGARGFLGGLFTSLGDSGNRTENFGYLGGSYTDAPNNWKKQRYGGFMLTRMRGDSASTALSFSRFFKRYVLRYSIETDGGTFDLFIDGVKNQTINCQGAQKYSNEVVVTFAEAGQHIVEIRPPATGFAYLETQDFCVDQPGIHLMDATLGGSAIAQMVQVSQGGGNQVAPIAIGGTNGGFTSNGIDAVYNNTADNTRPDAVICTYTVNDAGAGLGVVNSIYKPAMDYIVQKTYENNQPLILVVEIGGHYSLPSYPTHDAYLAVRDLLLSYANRPHVTVFDWQKQSGMNTTDYSELVRLGNRYYNVTGLTLSNAQNNSGWGGDFIHPNGVGNAILAEMMLTRLGIAPVGRQDDSLDSVLDSLRPRTELVSLAKKPASYSDAYLKLRGFVRSEANQIGVFSNYTQVGYSTNIASNQNESLWQSRDEINYAAQINDEIIAANTADKYGSYRVYNSANPLANYVPTHNFGGRVTLTIIVGSGNASLQIRNDGNTAFLPVFVKGKTQDSGPINFSNTQLNPQVFHITIDNVPAVFYWTFTGTIYGVSITATDVAVLGGKRVDQITNIMPSLLVSSDLPVSKIRVGQSYHEQVNGKSIEKVATEGTVLKPLAAGANKVFGLYRLRDKSASENQTLRLIGNVSNSAYNDQIGGITQVSDSNPQFFRAATTFTNTSAGKTYTLTGVSSYAKVQLYSGSNNVYLGLKSDGTWQNNGGNDGAAPNLMDNVSNAGRGTAFTFAMPTAAAFDGREWELRVYVAFNAQQAGFWHICEGALAAI